MNKKYLYEVIEDNAGKLHLFVFDSNKCVIYSHHDYIKNGNYDLARIKEDIKELRNGTDINDWNFDDCPNSPQAIYDEFLDSEDFNYTIVADNNKRLDTSKYAIN